MIALMQLAWPPFVCAKISMDETDMQNYTMHTAQRLKAENGETEKCQGVYLPSDDRMTGQD